MQHDIDDSYVFVTSLVRLQLTTYSASGSSTNQRNKIILWQNPLPASTKYCRPIKILLKKETSELIKTEINNLKSKISKLNPTIIEIEGQEIFIKPDLFLTMIDGNICGILLHQSAENCHIRGVAPTQINNL